ncbi:MAG TPA: sigma factor-like helix-turn-helix DNA-binding protein [Solirubrobacteraceae bacterium]|nr:sigma factor-like helix-turn-helix DNA-binding protein [Solirubrobacteraceae bacterium]
MTTRLAIDELRSARARRERYVGDWLPEPLVTDGTGDPAGEAQMGESLSMAMLVLLETLSPEQRAVLLLHDVFDYQYAKISEIVGKSEANVRQLATRARRHVNERRPRFATTREQRDELARRFFAATRDGDVGRLEALLAQDVVLTGDGGGKAPALAHAVHGPVGVARTLLSWRKLGARIPGASMRPTEINGSREQCCSTARIACSECGHSRSPVITSHPCARSSTRKSWRTSGPWRTSGRCCPPGSRRDGRARAGPTGPWPPCRRAP